MRNRHIKAAVLAALSAANALGACSAMADNIVIDGTLNGTELTLGKAGDTYAITQDLGAVHGTNLFHSFLHFNLSAGEIAEFSGNASITNIISRVTGGEASLIDGTIRSTISGANFWFVNPAGITIGPNGAIDVSGAVALGAADRIDFDDGASFFALPEDDGLAVGLTVASPVDFGFLQEGSLQGRLEIHNADFLSGYSLVAGPTLLSGAGGVSLDVEGDLSVQNMRMRTGSSDGLTGSIEINATGAITMANADLMTSMGVDSTGGDILIQGGELVTISRSSVVAESIEAGVPTGNVSIVGSGVLIRDQSVIASNFLSTAEFVPDDEEDDFDTDRLEVGPGNISILATGSSSETTPETQLTTATDGVIRIADSAVLVKNVGGRNTADKGGIRIGRVDQFRFEEDEPFEEDPFEDPIDEPDFDPDDPGFDPEAPEEPEPEPDSEDIFGADHLVIAGSVIATDATGNGAADDILLGGRQGVWITGSSISARASETALASGQISVGAGDAGVNVQSSTLDTSNAITGDPVFINESSFDFGDVFDDDIEIFADGGIALDRATLRTDSSGVKSGGDIALIADTVRINGGALTTSVTKLRFSDEPVSRQAAGDIFIFAANDSQSATPLVIENGAVLRANSTDNGDPLTDPQGARAGFIELDSAFGSISISNATLESASNGRNGDSAGQILISGLGLDIADSTFNTAALSQNPNAFNGSGAGNIVLDALLDTDAGAVKIARSHFTSNSTAVGFAGAIRVSGKTADIADSTFETSSGGGGAAGGIDVGVTGDDFTTGADRVLRISNSTFTSSTVSSPTTFGGAINISSSIGSIEVDRATFNTSILSNGPTTQGFDSGLGFPEASIRISAGIGFGVFRGSLQVTDSVLQSTTSGAISGGDIFLAGDSVLLSGSMLAASSDTPMLPPVVSTDPNFPVFGPQVGNAGSINIFASQSDDAGIQQAFVPSGLTIDSTTILTTAAGNRGGDIGIDSRAQLQLRNSSLVASAGGVGASGNISITGNVNATLQGTSVVARAESGTAGTVGITLRDGASGPLVIDSSSLATNASNAAGGSIALDAAGNQFVLRGSSIVASAGGSGTGGDVAIRNVAGTTLQDSQLQALADAGNGGTISIDLVAGSVGPILLDNSFITTNANSGNGGSITVNAADHQVALRGSSIVASAGGGGMGGSIALVDASSATLADSQVQALANAGTGGTISINLTGNSVGALSLNNSAITTNATNANGGSIMVDAKGGQVSLQRNSSIVASAGGTGLGGDISILNAAGTRLQDSQVQALADAGSGGTIRIDLTSDTTGAITLQNSSIATKANTGSGGNISLEAEGREVQLSGSSIVASAGGNGTGGSISILNSGGTSLQGSQVQALAQSGTGGTINITQVQAAGAVNIDGSSIMSNASNANGGNIAIDAAGSRVQVRGSTIVASAGGTGQGGDISIMNSGGTTLQGSQVQALANAGAGGTINIDHVGRPGGAVVIDNSSITTNASNANGGNITVDAAGDQVVLRNSSIVASAGGAGTGGDISILNAGGATLQNVQIQALANAGAGGSISLSVTPGNGPIVIQKSAITTNAVAAGGGNITLEAGGNQLLLRDSTILASAGAAGTGGNIAMNDVGQTIMQRGQVLARADAGNGGTISINLRDGALFLRDAQSTISADSNSGNDGQVAINSPDTDLNPAVEPQDASLGDTPELSANACRPAADTSPSTFVRETSGGVGASPDNYLVSTQPAADSAKTAAVQRAELGVAMASLETGIAGCREGAAK